jgi:uncharacterized metal-binding protein
MMATKVPYVGVISCSGEGLPEGTVSRVACRKVLEDLRPGKSVTICLPLFIAGGEEERKFASQVPTITVDGCEKLCAAKATEKLSGKPVKSFIITEILNKKGLPRPAKVRHLEKEEKDAAQAVAEEIAKAIDDILEEA